MAILDTIFYWTGVAVWSAGGLLLTTGIILHMTLKSVSNTGWTHELKQFWDWKKAKAENATKG